MPDAIVIPDADGSPPVDLALQGAHDAAVAEGGAQVREELAAESATEAQAAAELAIAAAEENATTAAAVIEATASAQSSAEESASLAESIRDMHQAQLAAIRALGDELRASRETQAPAPEPAKPKAERPPGEHKPRWVRR